MTEPEFNGLSVRVPMEDFKFMLRQLWRCRNSLGDPKCAEMWEKYKDLDFGE
tara:strand:- start:271 stop:426 length:156 start_codon:yes stop_codon:yes gene_type:complete